MGETKHTPGPWSATFDEFGQAMLINSDARRADNRAQIATVEVGFNEPFESEQEANCCLIAAAPELLEALITCEQMVGTSNGPPNWDWVREVIAKASGETR